MTIGTRRAAACFSFMVAIAPFLILPSAFSQTRASFDSTLAGVKSLFEGGSYISAELQARRAVEEKNITDSLRVQFEKYIAYSLVAQDKNDAAVEHFDDALKIEPSLTLDTVLTSPKILAVYERAKNQFLSQKSINGPRQKSDYALMSGESAEEDGGTRQGPTFRAILFPGWEQVHQEEGIKGDVLLCAGIVTAVSGIASALLCKNARSSYLSAATSSLASSRYNTYNSYYHAEYYSFSAFILVYAYSALDAFVSLPAIHWR